jgi:hypothetical protein
MPSNALYKLDREEFSMKKCLTFLDFTPQLLLCGTACKTLPNTLSILLYYCYEQLMVKIVEGLGKEEEEKRCRKSIF